MTPIPPKLRKIIDADPFYKTCALYGQKDHVCGGRITMEHTHIYAGKQIQELWAIIPICARGQEVDEYQDAHTMNKQMNKWVALNRASDADLSRFYKASPSYARERDRLNKLFGPYVHKIAPQQPKTTQAASELKYENIPVKSPVKQLWFPVTHREKKMLQEMIEFYADVFDKYMSPFQMIADCIEKEYRVVKKYKEDPRYKHLVEERLQWKQDAHE